MEEYLKMEIESMVNQKLDEHLATEDTAQHFLPNRGPSGEIDL